MAQIICLANSKKHSDRCIAGIEISTGKWIRPVCAQFPNDGRVPENVRLINNQEPALLDILDIPLANKGPDFGFECENFTIAPGEWERVGKVQPVDIIQYQSRNPQILHNSYKYVDINFLQALPFHQRHTLQLVYTSKLSIQKKLNSRGGTTWKGNLISAAGQTLTDASITDPEFVKRLDAGNYPQNPCLVTVSLSMPYKPSETWDGGDPCWKLIAGLIELSNFDLVLVKMRQIGWSQYQELTYLQKTYNKQSCQELTDEEITQFLNHLKSLPN